MQSDIELIRQALDYFVVPEERHYAPYQQGRAALDRVENALRDTFPYVNGVASDPAHYHDWRGETARDIRDKVRAVLGDRKNPA
jgi:hypothetical protein